MRGKYSMVSEWNTLHVPPTNMKDAYRKLRCLSDLEEKVFCKSSFLGTPPSKRRVRLLKTYFAFYRAAQKSKAG